MNLWVPTTAVTVGGWRWRRSATTSTCGSYGRCWRCCS
jgi:hypothetical protein